MVSRYMKGVFNARPALPKHCEIYDPEIILSSLDYKSDLNDSLIVLSRKLAVMVTLLSGQRVDTVSRLNLEDIMFNDNGMVIQISNILKQTRPGYHQIPLTFSKYPNKNLCVVSCMHLYLEKCSYIRGDINELWLTTTLPTRPASKNTVANWIKHVLKDVGLCQFSPHSLRAAATSKAVKSLTVDRILLAGGWSSDSVFRKFYNLPVKEYNGIDSAVLRKVE